MAAELSLHGSVAKASARSQHDLEPAVDGSIRVYLQRAEKRRPLRRHPNDYNFDSLIVLAVIAGAFLLVTWVATKGFSSSFKSLP